ncbi:hypothetical protein HK102_005257, partial [Quaeritorhiza haematococci]
MSAFVAPYKGLGCANEYIASSQTNNPQTVWASSVLSRYQVHIHILCWGIPAIFVGISLGTNSIMYSVGSICLIAPDKIDALFFGPITAVTGLAFVLQVSTTIWIIRNNIKNRRLAAAATNRIEVGLPGSMAETALQPSPVIIVGVWSAQYRTYGLAFGILILLVAYWLFYRDDVRRLLDSLNPTKINPLLRSGFVDWFICLVKEQPDPDICHDKIKEYIPAPWRLAVAEAMLSLGGTAAFLGFFAPTLWNDWG